MKRYSQIKLKENEKKFKGEDYYDHLYNDRNMVYELELYLENDKQLYRQQFVPIIENIKRKLKQGKYDHNLAPKLWLYFVENGLKKYAKEIGENSMPWNQYLSVKDRKILAMKLADYYDVIISGEFN